MSDPKYPIPEDPSYRVRDIRAIQDEDYVSATEVVNPIVEAALESIEYLNKHKAELSADGKVPTSQLPSMDYIPTSQKGAANGVPTLDAGGKVPTSQLPTLGGHAAQATAPTNTNLLWIDTGNGNILKFYDTASKSWKPVAAVWS